MAVIAGASRYAATEWVARPWVSTVIPMAQMNPKSSRPTAVTACCLVLPRARAKIRRGQVAAINGFHYEFISWFVEENPALLCVHCAAVLFDRGLVIFPSTFKAGKSMLSVQLAAAGARVFCDDVLPIEGSNNHGMAIGILPRIRLPVPEEMGASFHDFLRPRKGPRNSSYLYVKLTEDELAPLGTTAPICGIVTLQRDPEAEPELIPSEKSETLKQLISQNFAREGPPLEILDRLHAIVTGADCYTLRYATGEQAAALLQDAFGGSVKPTVAQA